MERSLTIGALRRALSQRAPGPGVLHHPDRGSQYACGNYRELLEQNGMTGSMNWKGNYWDNAVFESFFVTLEKELVNGAAWQTSEEARAALFEYIEVWYNREHQYSSIGYLSPVDDRAKYEMYCKTQMLLHEARSVSHVC